MQMPGAFTGTASSTTSQMEKMLRVFSLLYETQMTRQSECGALVGPSKRDP
jgi:hypothetical protein